MGEEMVDSRVIPLFQVVEDDSVANIRLNVAKAMKELKDKFSAENLSFSSFIAFATFRRMFATLSSSTTWKSGITLESTISSPICTPAFYASLSRSSLTARMCTPVTRSTYFS